MGLSETEPSATMRPPAMMTTREANVSASSSWRALACDWLATLQVYGANTARGSAAYQESEMTFVTADAEDKGR